MAPVAGVEGAQPTSPASSIGGHGDHQAGQSSAASGQTFASTLSQAIGQASGGGHADHGAGPGTAALPHANSSHSTAGSQRGSTHYRHFTIGENHQGENHGFQETALRMRAYRQELIASNIANADTPDTRPWISISRRRYGLLDLSPIRHRFCSPPRLQVMFKGRHRAACRRIRSRIMFPRNPVPMAIPWKWTPSARNLPRMP